MSTVLSNEDVAKGLSYLIDSGSIEDYPRPYLGMSQAGHSCAKYLWFYFRWASKIAYKPRTKRIFAAGNDSEEIIIQALERQGITVSGRQITLSHAGGFSLGHIDGIVAGVPDYEGIDFLLEAKSAKQEKYKSIVKNGIRKVYKQYYCQGQVYAHKLGLKKILFAVLNKNTSEIHFEIIDYNEADAIALLDRLDDIVFTNTPPIGVSQDPDWFECGWCEFKAVCHEHKPFAITCRTCNNVKLVPITSVSSHAIWFCKENSLALSCDAQKAACPHYDMIKS